MTEATSPRTGLGLAAPLGSHVRCVLREPSPGFGGERPVVLGQVLGLLNGEGLDTDDPYDANYLHLRGLFGETAAVLVRDVSIFIIDPQLDPASGQPGPDTPDTVVPVEELEPGDRVWVTVMRQRPAVQDGDAPEELDTVRATGRLVDVRPFASGTGAELRLYPVLDQGGDDARHAAHDDLPMTIDVGEDDYVRVYDRR